LNEKIKACEQDPVEIQEFTGAGHAIQVEKPDAYTEAITAFISNTYSNQRAAIWLRSLLASEKRKS